MLYHIALKKIQKMDMAFLHFTPNFCHFSKWKVIKKYSQKNLEIKARQFFWNLRVQCEYVRACNPISRYFKSWWFWQFNLNQVHREDLFFTSWKLSMNNILCCLNKEKKFKRIFFTDLLPITNTLDEDWDVRGSGFPLL